MKTEIRSHLERGWTLVSDTESSAILSRKRPRLTLIFVLFFVPAFLTGIWELFWGAAVADVIGDESIFEEGLFGLAGSFIFGLIASAIYFLVTNKTRSVEIEINADDEVNIIGSSFESMKGERIFLGIGGIFYLLLSVTNLLSLTGLVLLSLTGLVGSLEGELDAWADDILYWGQSIINVIFSLIALFAAFTVKPR